MIDLNVLQVLINTAPLPIADSKNKDRFVFINSQPNAFAISVAQDNISGWRPGIKRKYVL